MSCRRRCWASFHCTLVSSWACRSPLCLLDVSRNGVRSEGAAAVANVRTPLPACPPHRRNCVVHCVPTPCTVQVIRSRRAALTELLLAYNPLSSVGVATIATALRDRALSPSLDFTLRYLDVSGVDMGRCVDVVCQTVPR